MPKTSALDHSATLPLPQLKQIASLLPKHPSHWLLRCGLLSSYWCCLFSSVVEHWSRKPGVMGSIPIGGIFCPNETPRNKVHKYIEFCKTDFRSWQGSNLRGQSPLDFKSNALTTRPQLLPLWRCGVSNPRPFTCKANALPLSYIPCLIHMSIV